MIRSINWIITNRCNSRCIHCDIWQTKGKELKKQDIEDILSDRFIQQSYDIYKENFDISLGGGEPFLREDLINIVDIIDKKYPNSIKTISTNGLLTKKILELLKQKSNLGFKLNISVDGIGKVHDEIRGFQGAFKTTLNTIRQIRRFFPTQKVELKLTLHPRNFDQILRVYDLSQKMGCDFSFKPAENMEFYTNRNTSLQLDFTGDQLCIVRNQAFKLSDIVYLKGDYKKSRFFKDIPFYLADKRKPKRCSVLKQHITLMPDGDCYFCIKEPKKGNALKDEISRLIPEHNHDFTCKSCMLMCGLYKDYPSNFYRNKVANIESTLACNLDCELCTQKQIRQNGGEAMNMEKFKHLLKKHPSITHISFIGGEPFLDKHLFDRLDYLDSKGITYEITTNGTLIDEKTISVLKDCIGLKKINFSIDGLEEYHDASRGKGVFTKCVRAINLTKGFFNINVCTMMNHDNLQEIPQLTRYLHKIGVRHHKIINAINFPSSVMENTTKSTSNLKIQGPSFSNPKKNYKKINDLFYDLDNLSKNLKMSIDYEPIVMREDLKSFLNGSLSQKQNLSCKQLRQLRFDSSGERIICEFIRNKHTPEIESELSKNLLPICEYCCKLEVKDLKG